MARTNELAEPDLAELVDELRATKQESLNLRFRNATGQLDNTAEIKQGPPPDRPHQHLHPPARDRCRRGQTRADRRDQMSEPTADRRRPRRRSRRVPATRNARKVREGVVVSNKMDKTAVVAVIERVRHPKYGKFMLRTKKLYAHDEANDANVGDKVRVMETRPLSKNKRWRVVEVLERAR